MAIFKGTGVAIVTPMHEDGKVNYEKLEEILEDQIANSTDAIVICGTTGESSTLTHRDSNHDVQGSSFLWCRRSSYCNTLL